MADKRYRYCPRCGAKNLADSRFCESCGAKLNLTIQGKPASGLRRTNYSKANIKRKIKKNIIPITLAVLVLLSIMFIWLSSSSESVSIKIVTAPLTIVNYQSINTSDNFQQLVNASNLIYNGKANAEFSNVEFLYSNGSLIKSWLENYSYQNYSIWWLRVGRIPADSNITIYMRFYPNGTNLFNKQSIGEAPELSPVYGEYDNGQNVFNFYDNFAGTSLNTSKWINKAVTYGANVYVDNGLNITSAGGCINVLPVYTKKFTDADGGILAVYGDLPPISSGICNDQPFIEFGNSTLNNRIGFEDKDRGKGVAVDTEGSGADSNTLFSPGTSGWQLYSVAYPSSSTGTLYATINYGEPLTVSNLALAEAPLVLSAGGSGNIPNLQVTWVRVSSYPPNDVMPTVIFSNVYH